jgi:hypothetical protein
MRALGVRVEGTNNGWAALVLVLKVAVHKNDGRVGSGMSSSQGNGASNRTPGVTNIILFKGVALGDDVTQRRLGGGTVKLVA